MATNLKHFRFKHGAYYYEAGRDKTGRRRWMHLGRDRESALRRYAALVGSSPDEAAAIEAHLRKVYHAAKRRAKVAGIAFELTPEQYADLVRKSGLCCALTGLPFSLSWADGNKHRRPFVPSLDRIDSLRPYTADNCRLVLCAVNYALNEWGEAVLRKIAAALVEGKRFGA